MMITDPMSMKQCFLQERNNTDKRGQHGHCLLTNSPLAEKRPASLLNVVAEAAGVATDDMVLLVPTPVLSGALVTTVARLADPAAM